ncbi:MAG: four helix bundle protein [Flavobacteriales bacterium]|nr:four helix bundle protein [Flavobacteriales bacterium]PIV92787.1 MAG: four helix bundle protein [Flavobacteriaceae bacterium CG17_big_fil_post_rev_8_21_14_2_50_33_15]PIY12338.1 MAG: four helix bundle protein [Flavobacteriaceae bacterium CG_4_10_14_3_um_filter_33_47]PJB18782.1 MAG: four helix bundle protein [Flavobacteriaceae bacterium CG_4_9_14_3_um_filter_33_16]
MEKIHSHKDLKVWQESMDLVIKIYKVSKDFPKNEVYGLSSQLRRAAVSIPSNIAEGAGRKGENEFIRFLYIALGSLSEVETQLEISQRLDYINDIEEINKRIYFIRNMISNLIKSLK